MSVHFLVWVKKYKLARIRWIHKDLIISRTSVKGDEMEPTVTSPKVVISVIRSRDKILKRECDGI